MPWMRGKIFCVSTYLETKSCKTLSKKIQPNNIGCLNIHETQMTTNNSTNNDIVFFFVSDLRIVYYDNY